MTCPLLSKAPSPPRSAWRQPEKDNPRSVSVHTRIAAGLKRRKDRAILAWTVTLALVIAGRGKVSVSMNYSPVGRGQTFGVILPTV